VLGDDSTLSIPDLSLPTSTDHTTSYANQSSIFHTTYAEFIHLSGDEVREVFASRHILILDCPTAMHWDWSAECMSKLAPLHARIQLQGSFQ